MAHFASLDENSIVQQVIVVANEVLLDDEGVESEDLGKQFCRQLYGQDTVWVQTSYNGNKYKNFAVIGYKFDTDRNAFIAPKPYDSWVLDEETCIWDAPVPCPGDRLLYRWDEESRQWELLD
tara:strand:- start:211 stop:576 length:366 start_codon:yes stop_codon:yes gene_type:complete